MKLKQKRLKKAIFIDHFILLHATSAADITIIAGVSMASSPRLAFQRCDGIASAFTVHAYDRTGVMRIA